MNDKIPDDILEKFLRQDFPLLERFKAITPGTYQHCINVGNICETLCKSLQLNPLIAKVCGYYHDIGKTFNPLHFTENQNDKQNPHDELEPDISYEFLTRHVSDSIIILIGETDMPREILNIISRHHGTTVLQSIYDKTKGIDKELFRYKCKKPNDIYSSLLMIVDSVEAAARAYSNKKQLETTADKRNIVDKIILRLERDEQLDEMRVGQLRLIKEQLVRELEGIYHHRTSYEKSTDETVEI